MDGFVGGPLMRARMSDAYGRASFLCAFVPPQSFPCVENDRAIGAATADKALNEARSILADVEPGDRGIFRSVRFLNAESGRMWAMEFLDERLALAESLRSFVEGN